MSGLQVIMVRIILSAAVLALLINNLGSQLCEAAPQAASAAGAGSSGSSSTTTTSSLSNAAAASAGPPNLVGGVINMATVPLNTLTASLTSLGVPNIATGALSAVSNLFQQAGSVYGR